MRSFQSDRKVLNLHYNDIYTTLYQKFGLVYLKQLSFMLRKLHISKASVFFFKWSQKKRGYILDIPLSFVLLMNLELNVLNSVSSYWQNPNVELHSELIHCEYFID